MKKMKMKMNPILRALAMAGTLGLATAADAAVYFVEGGRPEASDSNPGTKEAPFRTLSRAGAIARPGDQVFIRGGVYRETLKVLSPNSYPASETAAVLKVTGCFPESGPSSGRIVFEAYGDEAVVIDGSELLPAGPWQPVAGQAGLYSIALGEVLRDALKADGIAADRFEPGYVFWNDARIQPHRARDEMGLWQPAIPGAAAAPAWHYDASNRVLYAHLGGADPRATGRMEVAVRPLGVDASSTRRLTFRKLTVRRVTNWGFWIGYGEGNIVEDCAVYHARWTGIRASSSERATVRRCFVYDVDGRGIDTGSTMLAVVCDNVVADFALAGKGYFNYAYIVFGGKFNQFYHNVALQAERRGVDGGGYWTDCPGVGHIWMGNAAIRCGFYIESPAFNNLVKWNTVSRCRNQGLYLRANSSNLVRENLVEYSGVGLVLGSTDIDKHDVSGNVFIQNWLKQNRTGISVGSQPDRPGTQNRNYAQGNVYEIPEGGSAAGWAGRQYRTLEEFQAATGQELLGEARAIDYDELGLVWARADVPGEAHVSFPMFANPRFTRNTTFIDVEPYFWRRGDAHGADAFPDEWAPKHRMRHDPFPGYADERARPPERARQLGISRWPMVAPVAGTPVQGMVLHLLSMKDAVLDEQGVGCWSPSLPTVGGAEIELSLWMKPVGIESAAAGGGAVVYVEWSDWTGQNKSRSYLVGGETEKAVQHPEFSRGSRDWGRVAGAVKAPAAARRFALYLGLRSAKGEVMYGAVDRLRTLPGDAPASGPAAAKKDARPLVDPATLTFAALDLSGVVNRALADEQADDGKGGWTDQGPGYDMPGLETGRREHEGVPYELLAPKACVVLRSRRRPQGAQLPESVTIPVGAKARTLYFLHSGAWIGDGQTGWTYEIHYADGGKETIPVIGGVNVRDWGSAGEPYEFPNTERRRTTVWPQLVGNMLSPTCGLYAMEWVNPRPDAPVREIVMAAEKQHTAVPILLAITRGSDK